MIIQGFPRLFRRKEIILQEVFIKTDVIKQQKGKNTYFDEQSPITSTTLIKKLTKYVTDYRTVCNLADNAETRKFDLEIEFGRLSLCDY